MLARTETQRAQFRVVFLWLEQALLEKLTCAENNLQSHEGRESGEQRLWGGQVNCGWGCTESYLMVSSDTRAAYWSALLFSML
jgi:hypothetical protein